MRRRLLTTSVTTIAIASLLAAAPVSAAQPVAPTGAAEEVPVVADAATTLTLSAPDGQVPGPITATATLSPDPGGGSIVWKLNDWGAETVVPVGPGGVTPLDLGTQPSGIVHLYARFTGYDTYPAIDFVDILITVYAESGVTLQANRSTAYVGELPVVLTATVTSGDVPPTTVTFLDDVAGSVVELGPVPVDLGTGKATYSSSTLRLGTHSIRARYDGSTSTAPSTSDPVTVMVNADTAVHASFSSSLTKFYPYKDGIKDTVKLYGTLEEKATVTIRIYNSSNSLKRSWSLGIRNPGSYSVTWTGRTSAGSRMAAGTYKIKTSFKDVKGHTKSLYRYVTISWREATWRTGTIITKYGDQFGYYADQETDRLFLSPDHSRGRTMDAGPMNRDCDPCAFIYGVKTFQLNTAGIAFRSVYATMYGHGYVDREHTGQAFIIDPASGDWVYATDPPEYMQSGVTYNIVVPAKYVSGSDTVRVLLLMSEERGDAWDLHALKMHYQYAVWK